MTSGRDDTTVALRGSNRRRPTSLRTRPIGGARAHHPAQPSLSTSSWTAAADRSKAACSSAVSSISKTFSSPPRPSTTGTPTNRSFVLELAGQQDGARQDALPVAQDRVDHLEGRCRGRVERRAGLEQGDDLGAAVRSALLERLHPVGRQELGDRHAGDRRVARQRDHRVAVAAEDEGVGVDHAHPELFGDERAEAGRVEDTGHAEDALTREARRLEGDVAHRVERVGDDDQDRVGRVAGGLLDDRPDDPGVLQRGDRRGSCPAGARDPR